MILSTEMMLGWPPDGSWIGLGSRLGWGMLGLGCGGEARGQASVLAEVPTLMLPSWGSKAHPPKPKFLSSDSKVEIPKVKLLSKRSEASGHNNVNTLYVGSYLGSRCSVSCRLLFMILERPEMLFE